MNTTLRRKLLLGIIVVLIGLAALFIYSSTDAALIDSHFGIHLPKTAIIEARNVQQFGFDGHVAWIITLSDTVDSAELVPDGFDELEITEDASSKYREVLGHFRAMLPTQFSTFGVTRVFIGGPDGNSFIGISETAKRLILFRFWT